jgi:ribonuclease BN (tRNA processing enzyme)
MTVLGGCGAWPAAGQACSGYLLEEAGFRLLVDPGYATLPHLLAQVDAAEVDAVLVSHEHPDHCADLNPLLRARRMRPDPPSPLPVFTLPGAVDKVLALDRGARASCELREFEGGAELAIGPLRAQTRLLPHFVPNAGFRISTDAGVLAYTGDCGPDPAVVDLARDTDVLVAEATYVDEVTDPSDVGLLSSARDAARQASEAGAARLVLTHLWPGTDPDDAARAAAELFAGPVDVARGGLVVAL